MAKKRKAKAEDVAPEAALVKELAADAFAAAEFLNSSAAETAESETSVADEQESAEILAATITEEVIESGDESEEAVSEEGLEAASEVIDDETVEAVEATENESSADEVEASGEVDEDSFLSNLAADENSTEEVGEAAELDGSELANFESAEIEEVEFVEDERLESIIESILFASDRPVSFASIKAVFKGTNVKTDKIRRCLDKLQVEYAGASRGVVLEEVSTGYQIRTKVDNMEFLRRTLKSKTFKLSGPALEVLSIVAYKQPVIKAEIDEIRGVESGHLLRALMEKGLVNFEGKSELPGRPMQYGTTRKFLEIFGLRNLRELPTLSQIDEILPEGIDEQEGQKLSDVTASMSENIGSAYSIGEDELTKITEQLEDITTSSDFFEQEKIREKKRKDEERAQNIREAMAVGEEVPTRDKNWLKRYEESLAAGVEAPAADEPPAGAVVASSQDEVVVENEGLFEEDAPHIEDEIPFYEEADEEKGEGEAGL